MNIPDTAIEAAARALCGSPFPDTWEKLGADIQALYRCEAEDALTAAMPFIAAQAKAEALAPILALHKPFTVHPSGIGTKYCVHCWGRDESAKWPCATVNVATYPATIEGKSE